MRWDGLPPMPSEYAASLTRRFQDASRAFEDRERRRLLAEAAVGRLETLATVSRQSDQQAAVAALGERALAGAGLADLGREAVERIRKAAAAGCTIRRRRASRARRTARRPIPRSFPSS